jgi:hypothetical protein
MWSFRKIERMKDLHAETTKETTAQIVWSFTPKKADETRP